MRELHAIRVLFEEHFVLQILFVLVLCIDISMITGKCFGLLWYYCLYGLSYSLIIYQVYPLKNTIIAQPVCLFVCFHFLSLSVFLSVSLSLWMITSEYFQRFSCFCFRGFARITR